ncbi:MAG TPA: hypothetical protein VJ999_05020 [Candidatus Sulfotelmatobacter sp.]|nr:hypothetical protein [Candidatus Sulfotelmatobacter sp.]
MKKHCFLANVAFGLVVWMCGVPGLSAQEPSGSGVPVHTVVTVEARHGSEPPAINREDVMVYEGHDRDPVTEWVPAQGDHAALELFLLLDDGSSDVLGSQFQYIAQFINGQPASAKVGVAYMQDGIARIVQNPTTDHTQAAKTLRLPMGIAGINASPYLALSDLVKRWPQSSARREVLMVSDGIDFYYGANDLQDPYLAAAIGDAQRAGIIVSAIYFPGAGHFGHSYWQNYWGQLYLAQLAEKTGGESYYIGFTGAPVSFAPYLEDTAHRLTHQYFLTFLAKPPKKAGLQPVKIRTEVSNAELVSADQVYVPAAP